MNNINNINDELQRIKKDYGLEIMIVYYVCSSELGGHIMAKEQGTDAVYEFYKKTFKKFSKIIRAAYGKR